jgi:hypothetical protein
LVSAISAWRSEKMWRCMGVSAVKPRASRLRRVCEA